MAKLFGLLASAIKPVASLFVIVFLLGNLFWCITGKSYIDSMTLVFSTFLSLGSPPSAEFSGWLRLIEFGIDIMGLLLFAILTAASIKALERSKA
ncbi:MAG: hypothetical protein JRJ12_17485 [Deltaproteobacteria bacterium]|nr:hypothetical protein [Deltaproteobacteria bacterium]